MTPIDQQKFEDNRSRLLSLAYRMLGERAASEDIVQDTWLAWNQADRSQIKSAGAWLSQVANRIAIDTLRSARVRRERYVGPWLPEPLLDDLGASPEDQFAHARECELALLWAMERLSAEERSAFILRKVFDSDYSELATMLNRTESSCRKLVSRAKQKVKSTNTICKSEPEKNKEMLLRFAQACQSQDHQQVLKLLAPDVVALTDGGGRVRAALRPLVGADEVAQVMVAISMKAEPGLEPRLIQANGQATISIAGSQKSDMLITVRVNKNGLIEWIYTLRNPDKLPSSNSGDDAGASLLV